MATKKWQKENINKMRQYRRNWYSKNREHAKKKIMERKSNIREFINSQKRRHPCPCGESDIRCLDFHHKDSKHKEINLGHAIAKGWGKERLLKEMQKCEILCANCHRKTWR